MLALARSLGVRPMFRDGAMHGALHLPLARPALPAAA
jgi:hypothetical protein